MERAALLAVLVAAVPGGLRAQVMERDSAGVRIITQPSATRAQLGPALFQIDGSERGREPFFRINGNGTVALSDGLVVVNAATELRYYTRAGGLRRVAGGRGNGPGEFQMVSWVQRLPGDSVAVYDSRLRRVSVWSADGVSTRATQVQLGSTSPAPGAVSVMPVTPTGLLADGTMLSMATVSVLRHAQGIERVRGWLVRSPLDAAPRDSLAQVSVIDMGPPVGRGPMTQPVAFLRLFRRAVTAGGFAITEGADYCIDHYDTTGRKRMSVRVRRDVPTVRAEDRASWRAQNPAADALFPQIFPAYSELWQDAAGRLWAELYRPTTATITQWDVFDGNGRLLLTVEAPENVQLVAADPARVFGIHTDKLDVQTIQAFELPALLRR